MRKIRRFIILLLFAIGIFAGYQFSKVLYQEHIYSYMTDLYNTTGLAKMKITINSEQTDYYHLGDDISIRHEYNQNSIESGDIITVNSDRIKIETTITENDSIPDRNSGSVFFEFPACSGGAIRYSNITVNENGGKRYADAYASWEVSYKLEPIPDNYWGVVFHF